MPTGRWFSALFVVLSIMASAASAQVAGDRTYTIEGVDVDVTAADAIQARQQGIREAERRAVRMLAERMVPAEDRARLAPVDDAQLQNMVRGVEFVRERSFANRYIATLTVVFGAEPVKAWLSGGGVGAAETVARAALLIPLWKGRNGLEALDDRNPWRDAWRALDTSASAVPLTLMRGDPLDQSAMSAEEAYVGDVSALSKLNQRYRAPTVIVAIAEGDRAAGPIVLSGLRYDTLTGARRDLPRVTTTDASQLAEAARAMHARLDQEWRGMAVVPRDSQDALDVVVPIRALSDWVQVRQRLGAVPAIKSVAVRTLESDRAALRLEYFGTTEQLQRTLAQAGLLLDRDADQWRLQAR